MHKIFFRRVLTVGFVYQPNVAAYFVPYKNQIHRFFLAPSSLHTKENWPYVAYVIYLRYYTSKTLSKWSSVVISITLFLCIPSSGDAYSDRTLFLNFELWVEIFCVPTCFHVRIPKPCLSVRTPRKEIILASSISVLH